jgi:hypothetical protein
MRDRDAVHAARVAAADQHVGVRGQGRLDGLKPFFNERRRARRLRLRLRRGILACIDLADGTRTWKGGRYGIGQPGPADKAQANAGAFSPCSHYRPAAKAAAGGDCRNPRTASARSGVCWP